MYPCNVLGLPARIERMLEDFLAEHPRLRRDDIIGDNRATRERELREEFWWRVSKIHWGLQQTAPTYYQMSAWFGRPTNTMRAGILRHEDRLLVAA